MSSDAYRADFRRFPTLDMNRQFFVNLDRSPVISLWVRVKEKHFVLRVNGLGTGRSSSVRFSNVFDDVEVVVCTYAHHLYV